MQTWKVSLDLGLSELSRHRPRSALGHLTRALDACPESRGAELARILFYLGITMKKLGLTNPALRSWIACQRLAKRGLGGKMLARYANDYGMERQENPDQDDWHAFYCLHVGRYLHARGEQSFRTPEERRLVGTLVRASWEHLRRQNDLPRMGAADKCALFKRTDVEIPASVSVRENTSIVVDFVRRSRVGPDDRCVCGSGRPFRACCGRIEGLDEIMCGAK